MFETKETSCPLCSAALEERPKGSAILYVCPSCGFKIHTTKELFWNCFCKTFSKGGQQNPACSDCGTRMRLCDKEYSVELYVCPADGTRKYVVNTELMHQAELKETPATKLTRNIPTLLFKKEQAIECFVYQGKIAVLPDIEKKIQERIELWSKNPQPVEWACVLIGSLTPDGTPLVKDFLELPAYNLNREHGLTVNLDDIARIAEKKFALAVLHTHPSHNLMPSSTDFATFLFTDVLVGRPLLYILASPSGDKLILSFAKCWECKDSLFKLIQGVRKQKGGEKPEWEAST